LPGNVQSLIIAVMALIVGFLVMIFGLLADRIGESRRLMEEILYRQRRDEAARRDEALRSDRNPLDELKD